MGKDFQDNVEAEDGRRDQQIPVPPFGTFNVFAKEFSNDFIAFPSSSITITFPSVPVDPNVGSGNIGLNNNGFFNVVRTRRRTTMPIDN
jgi:hypothetical protein